MKNAKINELLGKMVVFFIICSSIAAFYLIGNFYSNHGKKARRIELPQSLFRSDDSDSFEFEMSKYDLPYSIYQLDILKNNSVIFTSTFNDDLRSVIYTLDLEEFETSNSFKPNYINDAELFRVSPDGEKFAISSGRRYETTILYDINTPEKKLNFSNLRFCTWLPDSSGFIAVDKEYLLIVYLTDNEFQNEESNYKTIRIAVISSIYKQIIGESNMGPNYFDLSASAWNHFYISRDAKTLYFLHWDVKGSKNIIYSIDLDTGHLNKLPPEGSITEFQLLNNGSIMIAGIINGSEGLYIYNEASNTLKKILNTNVYYFSVSPDSKKIVYSIANRQRPTELHLASFESQRISNDKIILSEQNNIYQFKWNRNSDMFLLFTSKLGGSTIYQFRQMEGSQER